MEKIISDLKKIIPFKETTETGDIILIAGHNPHMLFYALVGDILRDTTRKDEWWHVTLHFLTIPIQTVVWTLRMPQLTGQESFTMGGEGRFVKAVRFLPPNQPPSLVTDPGNKPETPKKSGLRVIK